MIQDIPAAELEAYLWNRIATCATQIGNGTMTPDSAAFRSFKSFIADHGNAQMQAAVQAIESGNDAAVVAALKPHVAKIRSVDVNKVKAALAPPPPAGKHDTEGKLEALLTQASQ